MVSSDILRNSDVFMRISHFLISLIITWEKQVIGLNISSHNRCALGSFLYRHTRATASFGYVTRQSQNSLNWVMIQPRGQNHPGHSTSCSGHRSFQLTGRIMTSVGPNKAQLLWPLASRTVLLLISYPLLQRCPARTWNWPILRPSQG